METKHTSQLNLLIERHNFESYLEIGIGSGKNFNSIIAPLKVGVDPEVIMKGVHKVTSDAFFETNKQTFDVIFIDGLHTAEQCRKDFNNALKVLNEEGYIMIHDTWPDSEETTTIERHTKRWHGDVYKFAIALNTYDGIVFTTIPEDEGITVVVKCEDAKGVAMVDTSWDNYIKNRHKLLRVCG